MSPIANAYNKQAYRENQIKNRQHNHTRKGVFHSSHSPYILYGTKNRPMNKIKKIKKGPTNERTWQFVNALIGRHSGHPLNMRLYVKPSSTQCPHKRRRAIPHKKKAQKRPNSMTLKEQTGHINLDQIGWRKREREEKKD